MSSALAPLAVALIAALWAGLLGLALEAPAVKRTLGNPPATSGRAVLTHRAVIICRSALLLLAGVAASDAVGWWERPVMQGLVAVALTLALLYLIAEGVPRALAVLVPRLAAATAPVARSSLVPFAPLLGLTAGVESLMHSFLPAPLRPADPFGPAHRDMLLGVFSLQDTRVAEVMTPRLDIVAVESKAGWRDIVELLGRSDHARIPVYSDDLDSVVGILYAKDLTPAISGVAEVPDRWQEFVRPASFVPESKALTEQLRDFQRGPGGLAIVVDEFGGTSGLVTLEDVLEQVVGEIHGEYDVHTAPAIEREGDDRFWVDGSLALDELSELLGTTVEREDVSTVGGLVYSELGRVPQPGEELAIAEFRVVVEQVERRRIRRVYFERVSDVSAIQTDTELRT